MLNGKPVVHNLHVRSYFYTLEGFREKEDIEKMSFSLLAETEADSARLNGIAADTASYKTYKIAKPAVSVKAGYEGLQITWSGKTDEYYLIPRYDVFVNGKIAAKDRYEQQLLAPFKDFPSLAEAKAMKIHVVAKTEADSVQSAAVNPDVRDFKGWIPSVPRLYATSGSRVIPISWDTQDVYDFCGCMIQVAKAYQVANGAYAPLTNPAALEWYEPALGLNPYESAENYKRGEKDGSLSIEGTSITFTVPLYGQPDGSLPTMYAYRARAFSRKSGKVIAASAWSEPFFVQAHPTSAADVVKAWKLNDKGEKVKVDGAIGAKQIFVEDLAAITANLGLITDGGLHGSKYNYWAVNDTRLKDGAYLHRGAFRVGGTKQFIEVTPILDQRGKPTGEFNISFVVNDFRVSSKGTRIDGKNFEVFDKAGRLMFSISPEGSKIRVEKGVFRSTDARKNVLQLPAPPYPMTYDAAFYYKSDHFALFAGGETKAVAVLKNEKLVKLIPSVAGDDFHSIAPPMMTYPCDDGLLYMPYKYADGDALIFRVLNLNTLAVQMKTVNFKAKGESCGSGIYKEYAVRIGEIRDGNQRLAGPIAIFNLKTNKTITAVPFKAQVLDYVFSGDYLYILHSTWLFTFISRVSLKTGDAHFCVFCAANSDFSPDGPGGGNFPAMFIKKVKDAILILGRYEVWKNKQQGFPSAFSVIKIPDANSKWIKTSTNLNALTEAHFLQKQTAEAHLRSARKFAAGKLERTGTSDYE